MTGTSAQRILRSTVREEVSEGFLRELLNRFHLIAREQVKGLPSLVIKLYAVAMSGRLVVFRTSRPGVGAVLVRMVIGLIRLLPGLIGPLLPGLHILFVDLTHKLPFTDAFLWRAVRWISLKASRREAAVHHLRTGHPSTSEVTALGQRKPN